MSKQDIRALSREELKQWFTDNGHPAFRANQVYDWLWNKSHVSFDEMSNLSKALREVLDENFVINNVEVDQMQRSTDGTIKNAVKLHDGLVVESVLIPTEKRITACVSSQVGCSLDCDFCATAGLKRMRNLNPDEIYDQVVAIKKQGEEYFNRPLTNIVMMGMGEPLLNYKNVLEALDKVTSPEGLGMAARRITLSTVGIPKLIERLADDGVRFNLAVSLHSAVQSTRERIMPLASKNHLDDLLASLQHWYKVTGRKVTFEFVVWTGVNDSDEEIAALVNFVKKVPCKVNIIQYNPIDNGDYNQAPQDRVDAYLKALAAVDVIAKVRQSRGQDIDAACGQLANKTELEA
ncbi:MAG: 23S rRNA (adenine(2503)-C(2))-methyltransferase RlmN [Bacteroidetes bacterium]|uniref:Probable dual-specificity RNA methyltransferase RlmN n=1 Tax=Phaeocystidibacter marisrubri TaxID=1577780 RepID=A0A6L3ZFR8_9FLAO|nr:23S rRNA (adenine(2503)-C(2))-methyltransferase RlmN [Phaeocystidibacter marisrubri]KAB2816882.1 23S rRNA (adenine(2503)-C(2))-methyltransferase RlmN [Phaeocystidibacter marisrubri]TNE27493.1 MAG: 23S rRNA (adenine(2503)-C(2))-methyltransferase RlmN [Bacteroidota bacterium]GGH77749.1 putative dual-specificity RNA methyltransferase RlmN [Phaeocystidibacter marisrubri]